MAPKKVSTAPEPIKPVSGLGVGIQIQFRPKKPDYLHWKRLDLWTLGQAVCLIGNCDPEELKSKSHPLRDSYRYKDDNKANELRRLYQLAIASIKVGALKIRTHYNADLFKEVLPHEFIEWAEDKDLRIPLELRHRDKRKSIFPCPSGTEWKDIKITLTDNKSVRIETPLGRDQFTYHMLNMNDGRSVNRPTMLWELLKIFAKNQGLISSKSEKYDPKLPDTAKRLNKHLRKYFWN